MIAPATSTAPAPAANRFNESKSSFRKRLSREQRRDQRRRERERDRPRRVESRIVQDAGDMSTARTEPSQPDLLAPCEQITPAEAADPASRADDAQLPAAFVRAGLVQRLFGGGRRAEDAQTGLVRYERKPGLLRPLARRDYKRQAALSSIRVGLEDLSELMSDIRDGLEASVEKQSQLLDHLRYLPAIAEQNARSAERFEEQSQAHNRLQMETIRAIREQIRGQGDQNQQLGQILGTMGREARDQRRDVDEMQNRLDRMRLSDQAIADNLSTVGNAVRQVSEQGAAHGELVLRMQQAFDERTRQLEQNLRRQGNRQGALLAVALILGLTAASAVAVVGFLWLRQVGAI